MKRSFNYASIGSFFRFPDNKPTEVLLVDYLNDEGNIEVRLSGGTVQLSDVKDAIDIYLSKANPASLDRSIFWLPRQIEEMNISFQQELEEDKSLERHSKNLILEDYLRKIFNKLDQYHVPEKDIEKILTCSRDITMAREVNEETAAEPVGKIFQASSRFASSHEKCGYVGVELSAPDEYSGSGDKDIVRSYWLRIEDAVRKIASKHYSYLESAICYVVENNLHTRSEELKKYCRANNH